MEMCTDFIATLHNVGWRDTSNSFADDSCIIINWLLARLNFAGGVACTRERTRRIPEAVCDLAVDKLLGGLLVASGGHARTHSSQRHTK